MLTSPFDIIFSKLIKNEKKRYKNEDCYDAIHFLMNSQHVVKDNFSEYYLMSGELHHYLKTHYPIQYMDSIDKLSRPPNLVEIEKPTPQIR